MSIHAWMLAGLLIGAPPSPATDAAPAPKLEKGLEITWRGTFSEAILRSNVKAFRSYETEARVFVWDVSAKGADIAIFTSIKLKPELKADPVPPVIVRLELARVDPHGKLYHLPAEAFLQLPDQRKPGPMPLMLMEGLPTLETSLFVEFPTDTMKSKQAWDVAEDKRPARSFRIEGLDNIKGARCCKLASTQQTDDWENPRIERAAWRRIETIWVSIKHGYTSRVERTIEKRDPQSGELGFRSKLVYEQIGSMRYPERFGEDRREEVGGAAQFSATYEQLLADVGQSGPQPFEQLLQRIDQHLSSHLSGEAVPYRDAILSVKRKAEAAKRGHIPPAPPQPETVSETAMLTPGKKILDVTLTNLTNSESVRLSKLLGRPALLIYYQPGSAKTAEPVLHFAQSMYERHGQRAFILPLAIGSNESALRQRNDLKLTVSVLAGREIYKLHGVESTPCFVVLDENGIVRKVILGWSEENVAEARTEFERWLK